MAICAFLGLGVMGYPMAGHLVAAGHSVTAFNRTTAKAERWVAEHGGAMAMTPAAAAEGAEYVFLCVGDDPDVLAVAFGADGVLETMGEGAVLVFLPGLMEITTCYEQLRSNRVTRLRLRRARAHLAGPHAACLGHGECGADRVARGGEA